MHPEYEKSCPVETFGGFFSPTTREVSVYTLCVLVVGEEDGDRDGGERKRERERERERCVEKMKAGNPVRSYAGPPSF